MTIRISKDSFAKFELFIQDTGQTKTTAIERALEMYMNDDYHKQQIIEEAKKIKR